jgi:hypothetical protein
MYEDPKSKISLLEKVLDAREDRVTKRIKRHELRDREIMVKQDWDGSEYQESAEPLITPPKAMSFSLKVLIGSMIFFVIAFGIAAYKFMGGGNVVSGNNIAVTVKAPVSVSGGEIVPFELEIKNNNSVTLSGADLGIVFPLGAKNISNTAEPAKRIQEFIGDILPGQTIKKNYSIALYGIENEKKEINITLEYKVAGSNSLFNKTKSFAVLIGSAPVSIVVTGPKEVNTNQTVDFTVDVTSNSPSVIKGLLLKVTYPFGFAFSSSNPKIYSRNDLWLIGDLAPGAKRTITFTGVMNGQEGEERGFTFSLGSQSKSDSLAIEVPFATEFSSVTIRRPFVSADIYLNGSSAAEYVSLAGGQVETIIKWRNNLAYEVSDVVLTVKLSGNTLDKSSIKVTDGLYKSIDNTIVFNKATNGALGVIEPGGEGTSKFSFNSFGVKTVTGSALVNPIIGLSISVTGKRVDYTSGQDNILFSDSRKVKITADPQLSAKALYFVGPFKNTGPLPPQAEKDTTYTLTWTVTNPLNNLTGGVVTAVLPPYIKWLGLVSPGSEKVDYDAGTGKVVWTVGNISSGAGTVAPAREVSFQISMMPSVDQIGAAPSLLSDSLLMAKDSFTLTNVSDSFSGLSTRLSNDPYFKNDYETVIQ